MRKKFTRLMSWVLVSVLVLQENVLTATAGAPPETVAVESEVPAQQEENTTGQNETEDSTEEPTVPEENTSKEPATEKETIVEPVVDTEPVMEEIPVADGANDDIETLGENLAGTEVFKELTQWTRFNGSVDSMTPSEDGSSVTIKINDTPLGANWGTGLKYTGTSWGITAGNTYEISYKIKSTVDRAVVADFDSNAETNRNKVSLTANVEKTVTYRVTPTGAWSDFMFYLGNVDYKNDYGAHDIVISDFSIKEVTIKLADGTPVEETEGNLLTNGTFKDGTTTGWTIGDSFANVKTAKYKVVFDITQDCADWQNWLMQNVTLESGSRYKIAFEIESSIDRSIIVGFDGGMWLSHKELKADTPASIEYVVTGTNGGNFAIALGSNLRASSLYTDENGVTKTDDALNQTLGAHRVTISNVRITELPAELPNTPNDTPYEKITDLKNHKGYTAADLNSLKDGNFTRGLTNWETWCEQWMVTYDVVKYAPVDGGMSVYIENTGGGEGNKPWDVQLNQKISLASNTKYVLSFKVHSEKARAINVTISDINAGEAWVKPIAIQKGETREVILNLPVLDQDATDKLFSIQMGNVAGDVQKNTLTFTDMKLEVNGYGELAERIADGGFDDGTQGSFIASGSEANAEADFAGNYFVETIKQSCNAEDVSLSSAPFSMLAGEEYTVSFVAGATENRQIKAILVDGSDNLLKEEPISLTTDATVYSFTYEPTTAQTGAYLKLLLGGAQGTVCVDTIRCDLTGYPEAMGLDATAHDIKLLERKETPAISEMPASKALAGQDIVLTFKKGGVDGANDAYQTAIASEGSITVNGSNVESTKYTIGNGTAADEYAITLDSSLFTVNGDRETFDIVINAPWYQNVHIRQTVYKAQKWQETWLEEFDGTALDTTKWSYQNGTGAEYGVAGWGNNEQQYYTDKNLKVSGGELTITAQKERNPGGTPYTSARIWTMNDDKTTAKFSQTYGRMEAKMKLAGGEGYEGVWPAFWMLPVDNYYGGWPLSGEIDILETRGREPDKVDGTVHYGKPWPNNESQGGVFEFSKSQYNQDSDINGYHVYAVEWEPGEIRWYVDDELYYTYSNWYSQSSDNPEKFRYPAPFDQDFYIILNMAIGGTFDNGYVPSDDNLPVDMKVDYVRVYQSTTPYQEVTEEPPVIKDEETDPAKVKSALYDKEFAGMNLVTEGSAQPDVWNLVTLSQFGGSADFETVTENGTVFAKITPKQLGNAAYSIQLIQDLNLVKGYNYRISFDAKTESGRKLNMKIGQDGTEGWNAYETFETALTGEVQHYKYEFQAGVTDLHSRVEFNLATSTQPVYIGNITYEIIDEILIDEDGRKKPLESGNHVYNGSFNVGEIDGLTYWHTDNSDAKVVRDGKGYVFTATQGNLYQYGLNLLQSDSYELTFAAKAETGRTVEVILSNKDGTVEYKKETVTFTTDRETKKVTFTMPKGVTDEDAKLTFDFGGNGAKVYITDIVLKRTSYNNVDWDSVNAHPLLNGDFESDALYWSEYGGAALQIKEEDGNHYAQVNGTTDNDKWASMLIYDGLELTGKTDYEFSFDVKASKAGETILVTMEDSGYNKAFSADDLEVGTDWTHYSFDLRFGDTQSVALKFQLGHASEAYTLNFDNVKLSAKGAPKTPGVLSAKSYNRLGEDVVLSYSGEEAWAQNADVFVNDTLVEAAKAIWADGKLTIDKSIFNETGTYTVTVKSTGYTTSRAIKVKVYPQDGDRIFNGGFNGTLDPWGVYILEGERDSVAVENGMAKIHYGGAAYDQWGNVVSWAIQLYQEGIPVEQGKKYQISFVAYATVERRIQVMRNQNATETSDFVTITKEPQVYEVEFVSESDVLKLQFLLSTIGKDGEAPTNADILENHDLYIDSVCVKEVVDGKVEVDTTELSTLITECEGLVKKDYTEESWAVFAQALEAAKAVLKKENVKQAEINVAKDNLKAAKEALVPVIPVEADKTELNNLIQECEGIEQGNYTDESWNTFAKALQAAKEVAAKEGATQEEVDTAKQNLQTAKEALTLKEETIKVGLWAEDVEDVTYTGAALKPEVTVYDGTSLLKLNKDYTVKYADNKNVGKATITISGKGNYQGKITKEFNIVAKDLADEDIIAENLYVNAPKNSKAVKPAPTVTRNGKKLKANKDYVVVCPDKTEGAYVMPGTYEVTVQAAEGSGYTGSKNITITLAGADQVLFSKVSVAKIADQTYDGTAKTPEVTVKYKGAPLTPETDYTVSYSNNTEIGTATVMITGTGTKYVGVKKATFKIKGNTLKANMVTGIPSSVEYTGSAIEPEVTVGSLKRNENYTVEYQNNTQVGKATVIIKGIHDYTGTVKKTFKITPFDIQQNNGDKFKIVSENITVPYAKGGSKPAIEVTFDGTVLKEGVDYTLSYKNNKKADATPQPELSVKGKVNFKGIVKNITFKIEKQNLGNLKAEAADILVKNAGKYNKVNLVITDLDGKKLKKGTDFIITGYTYADGSEITETPKEGEAIKVTAEGKGNYENTVTAQFRVIANDKDIAKATITVTDQSYTGKEIKPAGKDITVKIKVKEGSRTVWKELTEGVEYEIVEAGYSKNVNKGTAKLMIHGIGEYGGTKTGTFKIIAQEMEWADWVKNTISRFSELFR